MGKNWIDARTTTLKKLVTPNRMGLITDMDGTISHIVANPEDAVVTSRNFELLQLLRKKLTLVSVVSGRSVRSVTTRLDLPGSPTETPEITILWVLKSYLSMASMAD